MYNIMYTHIMCICVEKLGGGSLTFHFILSKLKFFVLKYILLLTKNNVFVLKTETGSSSLSGQHRLGCTRGRVLLPGWTSFMAEPPARAAH